MLRCCPARTEPPQPALTAEATRRDNQTLALRVFSQALAREYGNTDIRIRYFATRATQTGLNSAAVNALNTELSVTMDSTETVARAFAKFLRGKKLVGHIGWPERFFVWLNKVSPGTVGSALIKQLSVIRRHARTVSGG